MRRKQSIVPSLFPRIGRRLRKNGRIIYFLLFCPLLVHSGIDSLKETWETNHRAQKLYDSPLGGVYRIQTTGKENRHPGSCRCEECEDIVQGVNGGIVSVSLPRKKTSGKRYIVVQFRVRTFPALNTEKSDQFRLEFVWNEKQRIGNSFSGFSGLNIQNRGDGFSRIKAGEFGKTFFPSFEPVSVRAIFDTEENHCRIFVNGFLQGTRSIARNIKKERPHCMGLLSSSLDKDFLTEKFRSEYFELSPPEIYFCDEESEIKKLSSPPFAPYPYDHYTVDTGKKQTLSGDQLLRAVNREKNPDLYYAYALRFLYGGRKDGNVPYALELLEKAVEKNHVPAMVLLGLCHFRGYGVEIDREKGLRYLRMAAEYGDQKANSVICFLLWDALGRPFLLPDSCRAEFSELLRVANDPKRTVEHDSGFLLLLFQNRLRQSLFPTPKYLISPWMAGYEGNWENKSKKSAFADFLRKKKAPLAWWEKARSLSLAEKSGALDALKTAVSANDRYAYPEYLWEKFGNNTLNASDFTPERNFQYADDPLYLLVQLTGKYPKLIPILQKYPHHWNAWNSFPEKEKGNESPEMDFVRYLLFAVWNTPPRHPFPDPLSQETAKSIAYLKKAADGGIPEAQYTLAKFYLHNLFPSTMTVPKKEEREKEGLRLLRQAGRNGHEKARYLFLENEIPAKKNSPEIQKALNALQKQNFPEAFYLTGEYFRRIKRYNEAKTAAMKAVKAGCFAGFYTLALCEEKTRNKAKALLYWNEFVAHDRESRMLDRCDPYCPDPYEAFPIWEALVWEKSEEARSQNKGSRGWILFIK